MALFYGTARRLGSAAETFGSRSVRAPCQACSRRREHGRVFAFCNMRPVLAAGLATITILIGFLNAPLVPVSIGLMGAWGWMWWRSRASARVRESVMTNTRGGS